MPRRRYFIDTNVYLIAVTDPTSDQAALVRLATRGEIEVVLSDMLLKEISRVFRKELKRPAAALATRMVVRMSGARTVWAFEWAHLEPEVRALVADKTDVPHVCAAMVAAADAFVTDDAKLKAMPIRERLAFLTSNEALSELGRAVSRGRP